VVGAYRQPRRRSVWLLWSAFDPAPAANGTDSLKRDDTWCSRSRTLWRCWICTAADEGNELLDHAPQPQGSFPSGRSAYPLPWCQCGPRGISRHVSKANQETQRVSPFVLSNPPLSTQAQVGFACTEAQSVPGRKPISDSGRLSKNVSPERDRGCHGRGRGAVCEARRIWSDLRARGMRFHAPSGGREIEDISCAQPCTWHDAEKPQESGRLADGAVCRGEPG
jgi:hypothetical protein